MSEQEKILFAEVGEPTTKPIHVLVTPAFKQALDIVASARKMSLADIVRQAAICGLPIAFPEFVGVYQKITGGNENERQS